jgi:F0F1-type ATP synthase assembly protein I
MENRADDEIKKQWAKEAKDKQETEDSRNKKRPRGIEYNANVIDGIMGSLTGRLLGNGASSPVDMEIAGASRSKAKKKPVARGTRSRGKVSEVPEEDEEYIELD